MKSPDDHALAAELRALRPTPRPEFAAELDARAAAGFPRKRGGGAALGRLAERFRIEPRRLLAPAGGIAVAAVLAATVVVIGKESSDQSHTTTQRSAVEAQPGYAGRDSGTGGVVESSAGAPAAEPDRESASGEGVQMQVEKAAADPSATGPYASQTDHRAIERSAELVLGTDPTDVRRAAGKVFEAVHAYDGIVLESAIEDGGEGEAGASFELLVPSGKLGDALASFSSIAEVRSRQEQTADVTAKTVGLGERLQDSRATVESLLAQLADADSEGERVAAENELREERFRAISLRSRLADIQRRANLSHVSLKIESGEEGAAPAEEGGAWGVGEALGEAGQILGVAAGVALVGLAILTPFALLALLAWLARRTTVRRNRERALG